MKAEVTISNIYWNKGLSNFFFRDQAYNTLEELVKRSLSKGCRDNISIVAATYMPSEEMEKQN